MIIFNIWALPVGIAIIAAVLGASAVAPQLMAGTMGNLIAGMLTMLIGGVAEYFGAKGRLFFMPIWFLGVLFTGFQLYAWMGVAGILLGIGLCAGAIYAMLRFAKMSESRQWTRLQLKSFAEDAKFAGSPGAYWAAVRKHLFYPTCIDFTPEMREHNRAIVRHVLGRTDLGMTAMETAVFQDYDAALVATKDAPKPTGPAFELTRLVRAVVDGRAKPAK